MATGTRRERKPELALAVLAASCGTSNPTETTGDEHMSNTKMRAALRGRVLAEGELCGVYTRAKRR